jgi:hypothetical protein
MLPKTGMSWRRKPSNTAGSNSIQTLLQNFYRPIAILMPMWEVGHKTFKGASITHPVGVVECLVRRLGEAGAVLEMHQPALVPDDFSLVIKPELTRYVCRVIGRDSLKLCVTFV